MSKKDEALTELKKGEEERAATVAVGLSRGSARVSNPSYKYGAPKIFLVALLLLFITAVGWSVVGNVFTKGSTFKQETTVFVEQVHELATLATAEARLKVVIEQEDHKMFGKNISMKLPGTKREILLIVPATVIAGVNLKNITSDEFIVNTEEKKLEIILPRATLIQDPAIQMDAIRTFSDEGLFRGEMKFDEGNDLLAQAQDMSKEEATAMGLLEIAEQNAEKTLKGFYEAMDYTVTITFK